MTTTIGLIGLGNVGGRMAADLLAAGSALHVHDVSPAAVEPHVAKGAIGHATAAEVAAAADVLLLSLPNSDIVDEVVLGSGGVLDALRPGSVLVDMSTSLPARTLEIAAKGQARGVRMLDAPISFGPGGMAVIVGGDADVYAEVEPVLRTVGFPTHVGPTGHGHVVKLVQNLISGVYIGVVGEAVSFASRFGVDLDTMFEAVRETAAKSSVVDRSMPRMIHREFTETGQLALHLKDIRYALAAGAERGARMPFAQTVERVFAGTIEAGNPRWNQVASITWYDDPAPSPGPTQTLDDEGQP